MQIYRNAETYLSLAADPKFLTDHLEQPFVVRHQDHPTPVPANWFIIEKLSFRVGSYLMSACPRASMVSMSKWLVGSSRIRKLGLCPHSTAIENEEWCKCHQLSYPQMPLSTFDLQRGTQPAGLPCPLSLQTGPAYVGNLPP